MKRLYEMLGKGESIRSIARTLQVSRNTVRKYARAAEVPRPSKRTKRKSCLDPYKEYILSKMAEGTENGVVLLREIKAKGYRGSYTVLKDYLRPLRQRPKPKATVRFETEPGEQAQVDFTSCAYEHENGGRRRKWCFVMTLSWSRAIYVEYVNKADTNTFIRCHINAFRHFGGVPCKCLYDNTKTVVLDHDENGDHLWNERFLDFALRVGFEVKLCHPGRPETKGKIERGGGYVKHNFWPGVRFVGLDDLNQKAAVWRDTVADVRTHGTTQERPIDRLIVERSSLKPLVGEERLTPFLRDTRTLGRDGYVQWDRAWYGIPWPWRPGQEVSVQARDGVVEIFVSDVRVAVHPRALRPGQRFTHPNQWAGLSNPTTHKPRREPTAFKVDTIEAAKRPLEAYEAFLREVTAK